MRRGLHLLVLLLALGQAGALAWFGGDDTCVEDCEDDREGKDCPPSCPTCPCTARPGATMPPAVAAVAPPTAESLADFAPPDRPPPTPEPHEILHVPKSLLA